MLVSQATRTSGGAVVDTPSLRTRTRGGAQDSVKRQVDRGTNAIDASTTRIDTPSTRRAEMRASYPADFIGPIEAEAVRSVEPELPRHADLRANIREAESRRPVGPFDLLWFHHQVLGPWDYKQQRTEPGQYEAGGNFNFGATGAALGIPESILLREAGRAQQKAKTSQPEWGEPPLIPLSPWGGSGSFGDDPRDQEWIRRGIDYYEDNYAPSD